MVKIWHEQSAHTSSDPLTQNSAYASQALKVTDGCALKVPEYYLGLHVVRIMKFQGFNDLG